MDPVQEFLQRHLEHPKEDSGRFTLDPRKQQEWLGRLGLQEPLKGFLKLAQAACSGGSPGLEIQASGRSLRLSFQLPAEPAQPSFFWSPETSEGSWRSALALGLLALAQDFELEWSWQFLGQRGEGRCRGGRLEEERLQADRPGQGFRLQVHQPGRWWTRSWLGSAHRLLSQRLAWMPLPVRWNDTYLNRLLLGPRLLESLAFSGAGKLSSRAEALVYCSAGEPGDLWLPATSLARHFLPRGLEKAEAGSWLLHGQPVLRGWAALGSHGKSWSETTFVVDGVSLASESNLLDRPGVVAFISAQGLQRDLSGLEVIHNQAFRERLLALRPEVRWLDALTESSR